MRVEPFWQASLGGTTSRDQGQHGNKVSATYILIGTRCQFVGSQHSLAPKIALAKWLDPILSLRLLYNMG
jgi:hypothetical protein